MRGPSWAWATGASLALHAALALPFLRAREASPLTSSVAPTGALRRIPVSVRSASGRVEAGPTPVELEVSSSPRAGAPAAGAARRLPPTSGLPRGRDAERAAGPREVGAALPSAREAPADGAAEPGTSTEEAGAARPGDAEGEAGPGAPGLASASAAEGVAGQGAGASVGAGPDGAGAEGGEDVGALVHERLRVAAERCYPPAARRFQQRGTVAVTFCTDGAGQVLRREVSRSSGAALLDGAATDCVVPTAAPFPVAAASRCFTVPVRFGAR